MTLFGIDRLLSDRTLRAPLYGKRIALLAHPASVTRHLGHSLDALAECNDISLSAVFGPQHGLRGDKQDNMIETPDTTDPVHAIPVFSLYGKERRPVKAMTDSFDIILVDLQDLGCRVYTFITTLLYVLEACARDGKAVWVLDRPDPAGRPVEGTRLLEGHESFVGAGPVPMRHGMTLGEAGRWFTARHRLDIDYRVITMEGWKPAAGPGYGWPVHERTWVNPSPNAPTLNMARVYPGTVMLEGTTLSEGRGTTRALELLGAPDINARNLLAVMHAMAPGWLAGCRLRPCHFEPVFHKHAGKTCHGFQIHADDEGYCHDTFRPWRLIALALKAVRRLYPDYPLWHDLPYEYVTDRPAIDVIDGNSFMRRWVDDPEAVPADLDRAALHDEQAWRDIQNRYSLYG